MSDKLDEIKEEEKREKEIDQAKDDDEEFICQNEFVDTMITNRIVVFYSQLKYIFENIFYTLDFSSNILSFLPTRNRSHI